MRSVSGFSLGTSLEHYRCYNVHVTSTMANRISDQVHFRHKYITVPTMSPESYVVEAAQKLTAALKGNIPASSETAVGLTKLGELFNNIATAKAAAAAEQLERANDRRAIKMHSTPSENVPVPRVDVPVPRVVEAMPIVMAPVPRCQHQLPSHQLPSHSPSHQLPSHRVKLQRHGQQAIFQITSAKMTTTPGMTYGNTRIVQDREDRWSKLWLPTTFQLK